ncbi:hypothetical protein M2281_002191 [Mesorhizobium soli]|uniref:hypothetical protein n=1 Tax=Pseudaminobacter soli (ex Li et al. 2025) TaxID=1295366 RepID=UPI0024755DC2|nr:hypothetical protein [Mesorhizobium soli]MDH6231593.1 hypothetical protein [Mesorhizobium soli]
MALASKNINMKLGVIGKFLIVAQILIVSMLISERAYASDRPTMISFGLTDSGLPQLKNKRKPNRISSSFGRVKVSSVNYLGSAPYICTPSGFGSTSRCFRRDSILKLASNAN